MDKTNFKEYCEKNQYSIHQTRSQAFQLGWQSRQAEINQLQAQINEMAEVGLGQESALREKDKQIESTLLQLSGFLRLVEEDLICEEAVARVVISNIRRLEKALRGDDDINVTR